MPRTAGLRWFLQMVPVMLALLKPWKGSEERFQNRISDRRGAGDGGYCIQIPGMVGSWCAL
jgi:hypothetical protein